MQHNFTGFCWSSISERLPIEETARAQRRFSASRM